MNNPFTEIELKYMFDCQKDKKLFKIEKKSGDEKVSVEGDKVERFDIWKDDYIIFLNADHSNGGHGHAINRILDYNEFKFELCKGLKIDEPTQMSMF